MAGKTDGNTIEKKDKRYFLSKGEKRKSNFQQQKLSQTAEDDQGQTDILSFNTLKRKEGEGNQAPIITEDRKGAGRASSLPSLQKRPINGSKGAQHLHPARALAAASSVSVTVTVTVSAAPDDVASFLLSRSLLDTIR